MSKFIQETLYFMLILIAATTAGKPCNSGSLNVLECGKNQQCVMETLNQNVGSCQCSTGYVMVVGSDECILSKKADISGDPSTSSLVDSTKDSHVAAAIIVPLLLIAIVICGVFVGYKYKVVSWVRGKLNQRSMNYDEVMIGQDMDDDDPPLR